MPRTLRARRLGRAASTIALTCCGAAWGQGEVLPVEAGECEVELAAARERAAGGRAAFADEAALACGVGAGSELALAAGRDRGGGDVRAWALAVEAKTTLDALHGRWPALTWVLGGGLAWQREGGRGWRGQEAFVRIELAREAAGGWWLEAGVGHARDVAARLGRTTWSVGFERELGEADTVTAALDGDDRAPPTVGAAYRREVADGIDAGIGARVRLGMPRERGVEFTLTIGF